MGHSEPAQSTLVQACLTQVARWVPHQGPLKDFIHHNTLHAFQHFPFYEGCLRASRLYGAWTFFPLSRYRELYRHHEISKQALEEVVQESTLSVAHQIRTNSPPSGWVSQLLEDQWGRYRPTLGIAETGLRSRWRTIHGLKLNHRIHPKLFRLLGQFLDQGIAMWEAPHPDCTLFEFVKDLAANSWLPLRPWSNSNVRFLFELTPEEAIEHVLNRFLGPGQQAHYERYLLEMCLAHPGWSGMAQELESHPEYLLDPRKLSLRDLCSLELIAEYAYVTLDLGEQFPALIGPRYTAPSALPYTDEYDLESPPAEQVAQLFQQAFERTYQCRLVELLRTQNLDNSLPDDPEAPKVQAFFCLDDREGSIRRHLEAQDPLIETFGFAGFFGVDCAFQGVDDAFPSKHCPAPMHPKHLIKEHRKDSRRDKKSLQLHEIHENSHTLMRGFIISQTLGLWSAVKLALSIFRPGLNPLATSSLERVDSGSTLEIHSESEADESSLHTGYTYEEMADRVERVLRSSGLISRPLAPLVVFVGHGSSSINNPYFAAYDCGACSGRGGGPNARAVALMGNSLEVRALLRERGIEIPSSTRFLGSLHDTTRDEMQYYDLDTLPESHLPRFEELRRYFETAVALNAKERCRRFATLPTKLDPRDAILAVRRRSVSIFEPRPELNHATNASCIVGRRRLTKRVNLNRRAFLNSYDPTIDPNGEILASILSAVVPVCGGINLEYYFSRMDPQEYGSGSKLPHNIQGLIGVINGTEGDLLTGLPTQMTEVHDPIRMLFLVEQTPTITQKAVESHPAIFQWVLNGWLRLLSWDYLTDQWYEWKADGFELLETTLGVRS